MALSLPPDQQKRTRSSMAMRTSEHIVYEGVAQYAGRRQGNEQRRTGARTLRLAEMGRSGAAPLRLQGGTNALVFAGEAVVHAYADVAAEGGKADGVLVLLVEKVGGASV